MKLKIVEEKPVIPVHIHSCLEEFLSWEQFDSQISLEVETI